MKYICKSELFEDGRIIEIPGDAIKITINNIDENTSQVQWLEPLQVEVKLEPR